MRSIVLLIILFSLTGCSQFSKSHKEQNPVFGATVGTMWDLMRGEDFGSTYMGTAGGKLPKNPVYSFGSNVRHMDDNSISQSELAQATNVQQSYQIPFELADVEQVNEEAVAIIIGNRNYQDFSADVPDVDFAHNDAELVYQYVTKSLGIREDNVLVIKDATQAQLLSVFGSRDNPAGKLANRVRAGRSDVFVFYSGHGTPGLKDHRGYLLPVDADPSMVEINGYPLELLYENLNKIPARNMTVAIDACFSGMANGGALVKNASSIGLKVRKPTNILSNATLITAAGDSEVASWDKSARLGLMTRHLIEGLSGRADLEQYGNHDGQVDVAELKRYLGEEIPFQARKEYGREQHPEFSGNGRMLVKKM